MLYEVKTSLLYHGVLSAPTPPPPNNDSMPAGLNTFSMARMLQLGQDVQEEEVKQKHLVSEIFR